MTSAEVVPVSEATHSGAPCGPTPAGTTRSSWPPAATPSPRRASAASLEEIARRAGVGIGTLYRHFPTRQALLEAVYVEEVDALCRSAADLADREPWDALVAWLHRFVEYVATKQALSEELFAYVDRDADVFHRCHTMLLRRRANRCWCGPRRPAWCGPTPTSPTSCAWWPGSPRSSRPPPSRSNGFSAWPSTGCASNRRRDSVGGVTASGV